MTGQAPRPENQANLDDLRTAAWIRDDGSCPCCRKAMLRDDFALLTRVVVLGDTHSTAKCSLCKAWVKVPVQRCLSHPRDAVGTEPSP